MGSLPEKDAPNAASISDPLHLFINGEQVHSKETFQVVNPLTGKSIYTCDTASREDYTKAIESAHEAFKSWSKTAPSARRLIMLKAADILTTYLEKDAPEILMQEVSAVKSWVKLNILAAANILRESAGLATHIKGEIVPADRPGTMIMVLREACGVVFAISPWNAPVSVIAIF
jgi:acyl-CoA reductase-like NAD-dependent aldehyde dehydrogenase